jgi:biotin synthase
MKDLPYDILKLATEMPLDELLRVTENLREQAFGNAIETCMIVNAKCGQCVNDCSFCSQSVHHNAQITTYPLFETQKLVGEANIAADCGAMHFGIVTSGPTVSHREIEAIAEAVSTVSRSGRITMCASLGKLDRDSLVRLKEAGLTRYHHNLETSEAFYPNICGTQNWRERYETVERAMDIGLEVCSGALFGLGESWEDRANLATCLKKLGVTSVPLNFLHAHPGTPLADQPPLTAEEALRIIALFRMILPETSLRICGGRPKILADQQVLMFHAGANALMTGNYLTTSGITPDSDRRMLEQLNLIWL